MEYNGKSEQIFSMPKNNVKKCFDYRENFKKTRKSLYERFSFALTQPTFNFIMGVAKLSEREEMWLKWMK